MWAPARPFHFISRHRRKGCLFDHNSHQSSPASLVNIYTYSLLFHHYSRSLFALPNATLPTAASLLLHTLCLRAASLLKASQNFFVPPKLFSVLTPPQTWNYSRYEDHTKCFLLSRRRDLAFERFSMEQLYNHS